MGRSVLVAGAAGALGSRIALRLAGRGDRVVAGYRTEKPERLAELRAAGCETVRLDLMEMDRAAARIAEADAAVLTPILTVSGPAARTALARGARRLVLFSSNNVAVDPQAPVYAALHAEEQALGGVAGAWTIVRPTMIYGHAEDGNLSRLLRAASRWPALPLPGSGKALQQPIHVDDLADLAVALLDAPGTEKIVAAGGPAPVTLRALHQSVAVAAGRTPGLVAAVPVAPMLFFAKRAAELGLPFGYSPDQLARIERDKTPVGPAPAGWRASIPLDEGLARLAVELGLTGRPRAHS